DTDYAQVRGPNGLGNGSAGVIPATMIVVHQFKANGTATIRCSTSGTGEPSTWANARITALQITSTSTASSVTGAAGSAGKTATLGCSTSGAGEPWRWANARITALQITSTSTASSVTGAAGGAGKPATP